MRTIVFSDTHLTDYVRRSKLGFLRSIIESADRVIIAGDFWDSYLTTFDRFLNSQWSALFSLLKTRETIYLYGNHDPKSASDSRVNLFSTLQADEYRLSIGTQTLLIQHGHRIHPHLDERVPRWLVNRYTTQVTALLQAGLFRALGPRRTLGLLNARENDAMRLWAATHLKPNQILVTGHNDYGEIDLEHQFICTGLIRYGYASYLKIVDDELEIREATY